MKHQHPFPTPRWRRKLARIVNDWRRAYANSWVRIKRRNQHWFWTDLLPGIILGLLLPLLITVEFLFRSVPEDKTDET